MADNSGLAQHHASVTVNAPVHQVYALFTHFNDFPKFMSFVKEVTYYDDQRSHWVAQAVGQHEWDAVNDNWVKNQLIRWHSINGLENNGQVTFQPLGDNQTQVDVLINYNPPGGVLGDIGENLGAGSNFDSKLQHDLDNFAQMVDQAPPGALDPASSNYLFHSDSAASKGITTDRQNSTMDDTNVGAGAASSASNYAASNTTPSYRPIVDSDIIDGNVDANTPSSAYTAEQDVMPMGTGTRNPVTPGSSSTRNPVMPEDNNTRNPLVPPPAGTTNPVMPPETGTASPVLPPERDKNY